MEDLISLKGDLCYNSKLMNHKPMDKNNDQTKSRQSELSTDATDADIWNALKANNPQGLDILYQRYASLVYGLALRMLANSQEAEDLTQEIFLSLWRNPNYDPRRGSLSSYLIILTRSRAIDKLRSRTTQLKFFQRFSQTITPESNSPSPFEIASYLQRSEQVKKALEQLPPNHRQVLEMAYFEGLSQSQIAKTLGIPLGTVKSWSRVALLNLRKNLQPIID